MAVHCFCLVRTCACTNNESAARLRKLHGQAVIDGTTVNGDMIMMCREPGPVNSLDRLTSLMHTCLHRRQSNREWWQELYHGAYQQDQACGQCDVAVSKSIFIILRCVCVYARACARVMVGFETACLP